MILQTCAIGIINITSYGDHTDPLLKSEEILKITDLHKLHVALFMFDQQYGFLRTSFKNYFPNMTNNNSSYALTITTRQLTDLRRQRPRTTFSFKLPKHNFDHIMERHLCDTKKII